METDHLILREDVLRTVTVPEQEANLKYLEQKAIEQAATAEEHADAADAAQVAAAQAQAVSIASATAAAQAKSDAAASATQAVIAKQVAEQAAANIVSGQLLGWAQTQNFQLVSGTRDANGALTAAQIAWPDGTAGVFTADVLSTAFPGAIDAWHATYVGATTKTVTQPAMTRDANGAVTAQPAILIS
ncbi:hypothetical protein [Cupriavidus basilensis]|uniref:hypothetical protein n=1 Tax=Cupriavidus basilensis TaxID=68895 RepID=UPI000751445C|nr:hypothetical protein [Cupriavidus basilensis]